jgi:hypothetical protein
MIVQSYEKQIDITKLCKLGIKTYKVISASFREEDDIITSVNDANDVLHQWHGADAMPSPGYT